MKTIVLVIGLLFVAGLAHAEGPCAKDRETLCAGVEHGHGRMMKCMKENEDKLSSECKAHIEKMKASLGDVKEACHDDAESLCPGLSKRKLVQCLRSKKESVSEGCKSEMKELKAARKKG